MTTLTVTCPNCQKQIKAPAELQGKKIRCKACEQVFVVQPDRPVKANPAKPAAAAKGKPPAQAAPPAPEAPLDVVPLADDDEDNPNPYGLTEETFAPRCPHCAYELESADAKVCLNCGYNTATR